MIDVTKAKAVIEFKADTSDLKRGIADVNRAEDDFARKQLDRANARNKQYEQWIAGIGKVAGAIGVATVAAQALWAGWEHNVRKAQLLTNTASLDIDRLRKGFGGLRTEMQALEAANTLAQSKFKLTSDQMEMVGKAIRQLVREGHSWEESTKKVTEAFVKLNVGALDDFGFHAGNAKTDAEKFAAALEFTAQKADKLGASTKTAAEEQQALKASFGDTLDRLKEALGKLAVAMAPIVDAVAQLAQYAADLVSAIPVDALKAIAKFAASPAMFIVDELGDGKLLSAAKRAGRGTMGAGLRRDPFAGPDYSTRPDYEDYAQSLLPTSLSGIGRSSGGGRNKDIDRIWQEIIASAAPGGAPAGYEMAPDNDEYWAGVNADAALRRAAARRSRGDAASTMGGEDPAGYEAFNSARAQSKLEDMFGPIEEFDAYKAAFDTLTGSVQAAFGAWIDGSMSAGAAFKKFVAESLKAVATQLAGEAIKHGVFALGSLAFGDFSGASKHGAAAAKAAAGAVAVGVLAKALHGGGGSPSTGAPAPGGGVPSYSGGSQDRGQAQTTIIAYGDSFSNDSARQRSLRAQRVVEDAQRARGYGGASYA